jgi:hypothetical protein
MINGVCTCPENRVFDENSQCVCIDDHAEEFNGNCVCGVGYILDPNSSTCVEVACADQCGTCIEHYESCVSCADSLVFTGTGELYGYPTGTCTCAIPSQIYANGKCDCTGGSGLRDGECECLDSQMTNVNGYCICPDGMIAVDGYCEACHATCATCSGVSENECLSCPLRREPSWEIATETGGSCRCIINT